MRINPDLTKLDVQGGTGSFFSQLARQYYMGNSCNHDLLHARGGEDLAKIYFRASICHHSDFFIS